MKFSEYFFINKPNEKSSRLDKKKAAAEVYKKKMLKKGIGFLTKRERKVLGEEQQYNLKMWRELGIEDPMMGDL